jgi:hypothetical protein
VKFPSEISDSVATLETATRLWDILSLTCSLGGIFNMRLRTWSRFKLFESSATVKLCLISGRSTAAKIGTLVRSLLIRVCKQVRKAVARERDDSFARQEKRTVPRLYLAGDPRSSERDPDNGFHPVVRLLSPEGRPVSIPGGFRLFGPPIAYSQFANRKFGPTENLVHRVYTVGKRRVTTLVTNPPSQ